MYQILKEEKALQNLTLEETKQLQKYVKQYSGVESEDISRGAQDEIDIQEMMNVLMDTSLELQDVDKPASKERTSESFLAGGFSGGRYS